MATISRINCAKDFPENYLLSSCKNFAYLNMEESEVSAAANYAKEFLGNSFQNFLVITKKLAIKLSLQGYWLLANSRSRSENCSERECNSEACSANTLQFRELLRGWPSKHCARVLFSERSKGAEKASCRETVVQKGVFGASASSLPV